MVRVSSAAKKYVRGVSRDLGVKPPSFRRTYRKYGRAAPSRVRVSKTRYTLNRAIAKQINNMTENKFQGYTGDCLVPVAKPGGSQPLSYHLFNTGAAIASIPNFVPMNLYSFPVGDGSTERNGNYLYIKKTHLKMEVQMLPTSVAAATPQEALNSTTEFRLMIVKANRKYNKLGSSPTPANALFLNTQNDQFGINDTGSTTFINMQQPINKRKWLVYKDMKFTLSPPSREAVDTAPEQWAFNSANNKYPVKKFISCDLPIYKKCHFESDQDVPDNVDTQWMIILQSTRTNYCSDGIGAPRDYRLNMCATTSASDN